MTAKLLSSPFSQVEKKVLEEKFMSLAPKYPDRKSLAMPLLYLCQEVQGFISQEGIDFVSEKTGLSSAHILELVTFYTMFHLKPVGKYHIQVCRTASCYFCGGKKLIDWVKKFVGKDQLERTDDGLFSWELVECIGSCGTAPAVLINDRLFECMDEVKLESLLTRIKKEQPDLRLSNFTDSYSQDFSDLPFSEIIKE